MFLSGPLRASLVALCVVLGAVSVSGCRTHREDKKVTPEALYKKAHKALESYDFNGAIKNYEQLTARFPFTDEARQARLDLIYAYYRAGEGESATDAADTFIRENPTHPRVDYAWYIKGLVDFERTPNAIESLFRADLTKRPPSTARKSFAAFKTVVEQYPKSEYAHDSLQRMVYLRDRLASYEVHVARYYYQRGAYLAAVNRAQLALADYREVPALEEALYIMYMSYDKLGMTELRDDAKRVLTQNYPQSEYLSRGFRGKDDPWWKIW